MKKSYKDQSNNWYNKIIITLLNKKSIKYIKILIYDIM